ncbi:MAG: glycosyltransferase [Candidatus Latescibacterota bacterium]|nr:glycosyltransferase [Candidatus Latescibacterota bacterium]
MELTVSLLLIVGGIPYLLTIIWLWLGLRCRPVLTGHQILSVSVVIAARNEEKLIEECLKSLRDQNYDGDWEVIVVDDRSIDNTHEIVSNISSDWDNLNVISAPNPPKLFCPKKSALAAGIEKANGEILLFTDADCVVPPNWISSMVSYFNEDVGFVGGYAATGKGTSFLQHILSVENIAIGALAAGSFAQGKPLSCTGRNLGYRKSVYKEVGGFAECGHLLGGDDVYMMRNIRRLTKWRMCFNRESVVKSKPAPTTLSSVIHQKVRHAAKGGNYSGPAYFLGISVYLYHWGILIGLLLWLFTGIVLSWWISFLGVRLIVDFLLLRKMKTIDTVNSLSVLPFLEVLYIPYVCFFPIAGRLGLFRWKQ